MRQTMRYTESNSRVFAPPFVISLLPSGGRTNRLIAWLLPLESLRSASAELITAVEIWTIEACSASETEH